jgi:hypothetical protein
MKVDRTLRDWFEVEALGDERHRVRLVADAPAWVREMVVEAHAGELPADWVFEALYRSACELGDRFDETDDDLRHQLAEQLVPVYTSHVLAWYADNVDRLRWADEAAGAIGRCDVVDTLRAGILFAGRHVVDTLLDAGARHGFQWPPAERLVRAIAGIGGKVVR